MTKVAKIFFIGIFSVLLSFISYKLCYLLAEKIYFDKFFYQKSIRFGYKLFQSPNLQLSNYGKRGYDIASLWDGKLVDSMSDSYYNVFIIGDSVAWGQGLKNEQRFASLLSSKLNTIRPTRVVSLAIPGWNVLNYLETYQLVKKKFSPELMIFSLVANDNLITQVDDKSPIVSSCIKLFPGSTPTYDVDDKIINLSTSDQDKKLITNEEDSWNNPINSCILDKSLQQLPSDNAIYYITDMYNTEEDSTNLYKKHLNNNNKLILTSELGKKLAKYSNYWKINPWLFFTISHAEKHPNALANQMYADILYNEIISNSKYGFTNEK